MGTDSRFPQYANFQIGQIKVSSTFFVTSTPLGAALGVVCLTTSMVDYLENLEGIEKFSNCEQIEFSGFVKDISALRNLANSKVKLVKFSRSMLPADVSKMDRLLNGISVIIYDE